MREQLINLLQNAYAPYSNYKVATIVETKQGATFLGVNIENASYGATICAERNAIASYIASGSNDPIIAIHVMAIGDAPAIPCFMCRQVMIELLDQNTDVKVYTKNNVTTYKLSELTPHPFHLGDNHA